MQDQNRKTANGREAEPANAEGSTVQIFAGRHDLSLLTTLRMLAMLQHGPLTLRILRRRLDITPDALTHHLKEAKHMGAQFTQPAINQSALLPCFVYLNNWKVIGKTVTRWIELETNRDLRSEA